ncbi:MAG: pitrilysin family protein [Bacteroidota bacterium]
MLDRTHPPKVNHVNELTLPPPKSYAIHPNLPLFVFPDTTQSVVQLDFIVPKGPMHTPLAKINFHLLAKTMIYGTSKAGKTIAEHIDQYGASLDTFAAMDTLHLRLTTLDKHFHHLVDLVAEILHEPAFPQQALQLEKKIEAQEIKLREATPEAIARKILAERVFGKDHPYGYSTEVEHLELVTTTSLRDAFERKAWPEGCVILSGASDTSMIAATQKAFSTLPHTPFSSLPAYETNANFTPLFHEKKEARQASIALGMQTITRTHPDYPFFYIVNTLFGGYFGSRLMQNIREKKGYTYGIDSRFLPLLHAGYFSIATEVKEGFAQKTCDEIEREIITLHQQLVPTDELTRLKDFLNGHLLATFDNVFSLANHFAHLYLHGLELDHYDTFYKAIQEITPADIQYIAQQYLDPTAFSKVIVNG